MPLTFKTFGDALAFARTHGRDYCHAFHRWQVVKRGKEFAVAIVNVNSGDVEGFCHA